jgi:opacity protein-like surface antigen
MPTRISIIVHRAASSVVNTLLIGIEADIAATTIDGDDSVTLSGFTSDLTHDLKMLSTVRARIGGIVGNAAVYGTGGFATARVDGVLVVTASGAEVGRNTFKSTHMGWTYGAGIDVSINERVSLTADYLWVDFKPEEVALTIGGFTMTDRGDLNTHTVRVGLNVRF